MTYLTPAELLLAELHPLHQRTPYVIAGVSRSMFSIARHPEYGGCTYNGSSYTYMPEHDELIRDDVLKLVTKARKADKALRKLNELSNQMGLEL